LTFVIARETDAAGDPGTVGFRGNANLDPGPFRADIAAGRSTFDSIRRLANSDQVERRETYLRNAQEVSFLLTPREGAS
jgi:hypothetical protein